MDQKTKKHLVCLIEELHEGVLSKEKIHELDHLLKHHSQVRQVYLEYTFTHAGLVRSLRSSEYLCEDVQKSDDVSFFNDALHELSLEEETAPAVNMSQSIAEQEPISIVRREKPMYRFNRRSVITILSSAAAILMVILFAKYAPVRTGQEVATLTDSINARWADSHIAMGKGSRLTDLGPSLALLEGCVELLFDNQTKVIVEGPTEFQIVAADQLKLSYGRVYAVVSEEAYGFTISTENSKIIDLGTEFGVQKNPHGENTEVYVLKGKVNLISRMHGSKINMNIPEGKANLIEGATGAIKSITCDNTLFVRDINSRTKSVWKGEPFDLASAIGGGNGFSPVFDFRTLNPNAGNYEIKPLLSKTFSSNYSYNRVSDNVFIDGVFVPNGNNGAVLMTSQGHRFNCPATSGKFNRNIAVFYKSHDSTVSDMQPPLFDGVAHGSLERPCVLLHSNIGITIDLAQIRKMYPDLTIDQLQTGYGLTWAEKNGRVDFYVLVDGTLKHENKDLVSQEASWSATIPLEPEARFLTFVVTDGQNSSQTPGNAHQYDFFYLLKPQLILK